MMDAWPNLYSGRGVVIGIKAFLIESERSSGRDRYAPSIRITQRCTSRGSVERGSCGETADTGNCSDSTQTSVADWGSDALGLCELEMLGFESAEPAGCAYSRHVCAGFAARIQRNERK
ncbi:MAG: hypothetical protein [Circular genetic element sp.]|nr:MAG: hypothetical protein [Circular genetic element sp.]